MTEERKRIEERILAMKEIRGKYIKKLLEDLERDLDYILGILADVDVLLYKLDAPKTREQFLKIANYIHTVLEKVRHELAKL